MFIPKQLKNDIFLNMVQKLELKLTVFTFWATFMGPNLTVEVSKAQIRKVFRLWAGRNRESFIEQCSCHPRFALIFIFSMYI